MLALLEGERQALASLDLERILSCAGGKEDLCNALAQEQSGELDEECRALLDAVKRMNETNRKLRNLIAANIQARLGALTGTAWLYGRTSPNGVVELPR
ncbi:MAG: hypothetical protein H6918_01420 [Sphingomonadaceae bacterium]|nr:hypothetical protein [Sphingomonadaceae bacterium]